MHLVSSENIVLFSGDVVFQGSGYPFQACVTAAAMHFTCTNKHIRAQWLLSCQQDHCEKNPH